MDKDERMVKFAWHQVSGRRIDDTWISSLHAAVLLAYVESGRHYHGVAHVSDCIQKAERYQTGPIGLLALWYHDAVYVAGAKDNEEKSAAWFCGDARRLGGIPGPAIEAASNLILATKHAGDPGDRLGRLVVDIDMSGLAAPWDAFEKNDRNIRQEFIAFPDDAWREGRKRFLQGLLAKERIFFSEEFRDSEAAARANISRKIAELEF